MVERSAHHVESAQKVDVYDRLECVCGHANHRCQKISSSTGNDEVDLPEPFDRRSEGCVHRLEIANIGGEPHCARTTRINAPGGCTHPLGIAAYEAYVRPEFGESLGNREIDAT